MRRAEGAIGKVLRDKWRIDRLLGIGGMASVFAATHRNGKRAAVKILHPEAALAPTVKERFLREGYLANKVEHPGTVSILDDDVDVDGTVFLVMELLEGETLDARLTRTGGRLAGGELLQIIDQVLDCLAAAHQKGVVHRDLKPGNLFISTSGQVKVLDFGIAQLAEAGKSRTGGTGAQTLGTPGFMPPEQARGRWEEVAAQSDLWAVGAVMFVALTGKHVHEAPTVNEQLLAAMTEPAEPIRNMTPDTPEPLAALIDRALSFDKQDRWPTANAMRDAVRTVHQEIVGVPLTDARRLSVRPPRDHSVNANAATIDAAASLQPQATTARPVTDGPPEPARRSRVAISAGLIALSAVAAAISVVMLRAPRGPSAAAASASPPVATTVEKAPTLPSPAPPAEAALGGSNAPSEASAAVPSGSAGAKAAPPMVSASSNALQPVPRGHRTTVGARASTATGPKGSTAASVGGSGDMDLFTKRR